MYKRVCEQQKSKIISSPQREYASLLAVTLRAVKLTALLQAHIIPILLKGGKQKCSIKSVFCIFQVWPPSFADDALEKCVYVHGMWDRSGPDSFTIGLV